MTEYYRKEVNSLLTLKVVHISGAGHGDEVYSPRVQFTATPYAFHSGNADTVDGLEGVDLEESAEIDADIATHTTLSHAHHAQTVLPDGHGGQNNTVSGTKAFVGGGRDNTARGGRSVVSA